MGKRFTAFSILLLTISGICFISACRDLAGKAPEAQFGFKDERSMREALKGTWILKEYEDSIDAGLTPKLLEYMLGPRSCISYDMKQMRTSGFRPAKKDLLYYDNNSFEAYSLRFDAVHDRLLISIAYDPGKKETSDAGMPGSGTGRSDTLEVDTAEFVVDGGDTILRLHRDSTGLDFVRYSVGGCGDIDAYSHLANSKYIAGKYYALSDTGRTHHILFTKCGNVEGVEYIDPMLKGRVEYSVAISCFYTGPDQIEFFNPEFKLGLGYYWEVRQDSLILTRSAYQDQDRIVLVKAL